MLVSEVAAGFGVRQALQPGSTWTPVHDAIVFVTCPIGCSFRRSSSYTLWVSTDTSTRSACLSVCTTGCSLRHESSFTFRVNTDTSSRCGCVCCLSTCLSARPSVCRLSACLHACLGLCLSIFESPRSEGLHLALACRLSACLPACLSMSLSVYLSSSLGASTGSRLRVGLSLNLGQFFSPSVCLTVSVCFRVYVSVCLSAYLSVFRFV